MAAWPSKATANNPEFPRRICNENSHLRRSLQSHFVSHTFFSSQGHTFLSVIKEIHPQEALTGFSPQPPPHPTAALMWLYNLQLLIGIQTLCKTLFRICRGLPFCSLDSVFISRVTIIKYHKVGGFKQQKWILSQFWRLGVQNAGVCLTMLPHHSLGEDLCLPFPASGSPRHSLVMAASLQGSSSSCVASHHLSFVHVCVQIFLFS